MGFTQSGAVNVFNKSLVDVGDLVKQVGDAHGGWVDPLAKNIGTFEGAWKGVPGYFIEFGCNYRKDIFDANNLKPFDTWDDVMKGGTLLKEKGNPIGIAINQKSNDANNSWQGVLWSYGASLRQGRRQDRRHQLARDEGSRQVRPRAVQEDDDERGAVLGRHRQQPDAGVRPRLLDPEPDQLAADHREGQPGAGEEDLHLERAGRPEGAVRLGLGRASGAS